MAKERAQNESTQIYIFTVDSANYKTKRHTIRHRVIGPGHRPTETGSSLYLLLDVSSEEYPAKIKKLEFYGYANIEAGDTIRATIRSKKEHGEKEQASILEKIADDGTTVLASFR